jgi:tryptophan-rich sensory protein
VTGAASLWKPIAAAVLVALATSGVGRWLTDLGPWYYGLTFPWWKPPDWLFGPAWTFIYACATVAFVLAWKNAQSPVSRWTIVAFFAVNIFFNILWSGLFFKLRRPDYALAEVGLLWLSIAALMLVLWRFSRVASWLLVPYLAWVAFAAMLNLSIVRQNGPFA